MLEPYSLENNLCNTNEGKGRPLAGLQNRASIIILALDHVFASGAFISFSVLTPRSVVSTSSRWYRMNSFVVVDVMPSGRWAAGGPVPIPVKACGISCRTKHASRRLMSNPGSSPPARARTLLRCCGVAALPSPPPTSPSINWSTLACPWTQTMSIGSRRTVSYM